MIRMLLTFLALMTGLAASGAPTLAQAMSGAGQPCAVVSQRCVLPGVARVSAHVVEHGRAMVRPAQPALVAPRLLLPVSAPVVVPVLVGIERARE
jgi:hypothetical protein